jgi:AbrB family looped-hinge helix DNA binding protein
MTKVTAKYQITIPPEVRRELGIVPGSEVDISKRGESFILVVDPIDELKKNWRGRFKGGQTTDDYLDDVRGKVH